MAQQIEVSAKAIARRQPQAASWGLLPDVSYRRLGIVNVAFVNSADGWVLIDAGLPGTSALIRHAARNLFGEAAPRAIILTHGHFDHVGALPVLSRLWDVPVYAHALERPFLSGSQSYPPADPASDTGFMARMSGVFPRSGPDVGARLRTLPDDGRVPYLDGWRWLHTPGHAPGHVSLWREADRTLIAGDAVVTTRQEAIYSALTQEPEVHGPPKYFTPDWGAAEASVQAIAALEPELLLTGHGRPLSGAGMRQGLSMLAANFREVAEPRRGRYARWG